VKVISNHYSQAFCMVSDYYMHSKNEVSILSLNYHLSSIHGSRSRELITPKNR